MAEARGVQPGPFVGWADQRIHEASLSIEVEILESAVAFSQVEGGDDFATEALRQFMMAADPGRWRLFDDKGEVTVQRVGQVLTRLGVKQRAVFVGGHTLRLRRFSDVHRAAEQHGVQVDSLRPCDPEKEPESQDLATPTPPGALRIKDPCDPCDPCDPEDLLGVTREGRNHSSRTPEEERAGREARPSEELGGLIDAFDPDTREDFEERAAILEFCGEMPRAVAEAQACALVAGVVPGVVQ